MGSCETEWLIDLKPLHVCTIQSMTQLLLFSTKTPHVKQIRGVAMLSENKSQLIYCFRWSFSHAIVR